MYTWIVKTDNGDVEVEADKVIVSDSGVLMFFVNGPTAAAPNLLVSAFSDWSSVDLDG